MNKNLNENHDFSLKISSFNIEILFKSKKGNYIINKSRPFDPLLNLPKDIEGIKNNLKTNRQDILNFLYFNMKNIEKVLYDIDEIIYFDFDDKNNNYFLKINNEEIEIEQKNEMAFLFYISLLINYNKNIVNFSFSIHLINKINSINSIDENYKYKNVLISKIILEIIYFYKSSHIFEEKNNKDEKVNLNNIENNNKYIIDKYINSFENIGFKITEKDLKLKNIDLIYAEIMNILLQFKDYDLRANIIDQLNLEFIYITKAMFNEISKALFSNESYINEYRLNSFDDLFENKNVDFYYILFKYILKNPIFIYDIEFLNEARKIIIKKINSNQNQSIYLSNNNNKIIDSHFKDKVIYIIKFFTNSEYEVKYINLNDKNILNSKLSSDNDTKHSSLNPFDLSSFKEEIERSRRHISMYDKNIEFSEILEIRNEESQNNIQNYKSREELRNSNYPLDNKSNVEGQQENSSNLKIDENNNLFNIEDNDKESFRIIIDDIQNILIKSTITLSINNNNENTIEYIEMIYNEGVGITYEKFKNYFSEEQDQKLVMDYSNNLFNNYKKLINFFEKIKDIAKTNFLSENKFLIKINLEEVNPKNNNGIKNITSKYKLDNIFSLNGKYKDENILNKDNYEGFISFSKEIAKNPFQISLSSIQKKTNTNSISSIWAIIDKTERYQFISFKKLIGKHQKVAEKIGEVNASSFLSSGYNELFKYNMDSGQIERNNLENFYSFFINKNKVIITQKKKLNFLNNNSIIETEYSCRNLLTLKDNNYIVCDENEVFYVSDLTNNFGNNQINKIYGKVYRGGIKIIDDKDNIAAITSNRVLSKGENKIIFFSSNSKRFMDEIEFKNYSQNYPKNCSFNLSENNCALMNIPKHENFKLLLCACKKYIKDDKNGILLLILKFDKNDKVNIQKFYDTKNFEVYCFCPILKIVENTFVLVERNDKAQIIDTEYFFVGGFDLKKREGLIKLYKVLYNDKIENIEIEYIQDIIVGRKISNDDSESFTRFKGPISCMIQSLKGGIFITCYDGSVYLFSKPDIDSLLKENYNILK